MGYAALTHPAIQENKLSFFSKLFKSNRKTKNIQGLGSFKFYQDSDSSYWEIEEAILALPKEFSFGAISGNEEGPNIEAVNLFKFYATQPNLLLRFLDNTFEQLAQSKLPDFSLSQVNDLFYLHSLTITNNDKFEFGLHAYKADIFIETFIRSNSVDSIYLDEGCCE